MADDKEMRDFIHLMRKGIELKKSKGGATEKCVIYMDVTDRTFFCAKRKNAASAKAYRVEEISEASANNDNEKIFTIVHKDGNLDLEVSRREVRDYLVRWLNKLFTLVKRTKEKSSSKESHQIFISTRFDNSGAKECAKQLKSAIDDIDGLTAFLAAPSTGADITMSVFSAMEESVGFIVMGGPTYGEDTGNPASTFEEAKYWRTSLAKKHPNGLFPINMLRSGEEHEHLTARLMFGRNVSYDMWPLGAEMPPKLVERIKAQFQPEWARPSGSSPVAEESVGSAGGGGGAQAGARQYSDSNGGSTQAPVPAAMDRTALFDRSRFPNGGPRGDQSLCCVTLLCAFNLVPCPLHCLATWGCAEIIDCLTSLPCKHVPCSPCDPNAKQPLWFFSEPIGWAASFGQLHAVMVLTKNGANPLHSNATNNNAFTDAARERHQHVVDWLELWEKSK